MDIFKANKLVLKLSGLLTDIHKSFLYKLYAFLVPFGVFIFIIPHTLYIFSGTITDLTVLSIQVAYNLESIMTIIKIILFVSFRESIFEIIGKLQKNVDQSEYSLLSFCLNLKKNKIKITRNPVKSQNTLHRS